MKLSATALFLAFSAAAAQLDLQMMGKFNLCRCDQLLANCSRPVRILSSQSSISYRNVSQEPLGSHGNVSQEPLSSYGNVSQESLGSYRDDGNDGNVSPGTPSPLDRPSTKASLVRKTSIESK
jgi:hypothetical protein